jgi:glutamine amidotransferase
MNRDDSFLSAQMARGGCVICIVDYGMGNLGSIANMLSKVGEDATVSSDEGIVERADKLILPGVGAFDNGMKSLAERGLASLLSTQVLQRKKPILGLCLGMQLFTKGSEEGQMPGLGWIDAQTIRFKFDAVNSRLKVPHMGWNTLDVCQPHPLLASVDANSRFYFVHSYYVSCADIRTVLAKTNYGLNFASVISQGNIMGAQFHPEKSHKFGMAFLKNFAERV